MWGDGLKNGTLSYSDPHTTLLSAWKWKLSRRESSRKPRPKIHGPPLPTWTWQDSTKEWVHQSHELPTQQTHDHFPLWYYFRTFNRLQIAWSVISLWVDARVGLMFIDCGRMSLVGFMLGRNHPLIFARSLVGLLAAGHRVTKGPSKWGPCLCPPTCPPCSAQEVAPPLMSDERIQTNCWVAMARRYLKETIQASEVIFLKPWTSTGWFSNSISSCGDSLRDESLTEFIGFKSIAIEFLPCHFHLNPTGVVYTRHWTCFQED